ncbi:uncharacterized protein I303_105461 [Kwoniella dejecticola CBS 10117]|uniref:Uncharacterized protein n=1 Tax=Kwoniella dejecticola CBS 10117 TaxID=1296121 RepID=A0A1A6A2F2_9TREE|nr:uncharacterized protein I303_05097 [Kwoniella dejecticola CBS 10117]OBR84240.1 hypothetical protein I303_05097 [Kwoniella dejecticola CBS 10117]
MSQDSHTDLDISTSGSLASAPAAQAARDRVLIYPKRDLYKYEVTLLDKNCDLVEDEDKDEVQFSTTTKYRFSAITCSQIGQAELSLASRIGIPSAEAESVPPSSSALTALESATNTHRRRCWNTLEVNSEFETPPEIEFDGITLEGFKEIMDGNYACQEWLNSDRLTLITHVNLAEDRTMWNESNWLYSDRSEIPRGFLEPQSMQGLTAVFSKGDEEVYNIDLKIWDLR